MGRVADTGRKTSPLLGESPAIEELRDFIVGVSLLPEPVLLTGDAGTGKSLAARKIHAVGRTARAAFVKVCCSRFGEEELEEVLFGGYGQAACSGVLGMRPGCTCYVAQIENLGPRLVSRLLCHLMEEMNRSPRGPRLVFGSRFSLADLQHGLQIDRDFLEIISTYHKVVPSLRDRVEDVPVLCHYQVWLSCTPEEYDRKWREFRSQVLPRLLTYPWPGNVTELNQVVRCCCWIEDGRSELQRFPGLGDPLADPLGFLQTELDRLYEELLVLIHCEQLTGRNDLLLTRDCPREGVIRDAN